MKVVQYQTGVDVLGFPIYMQHAISKGEDKQSKFNPKTKRWISVVQKIIKQY